MLWQRGEGVMGVIEGEELFARVHKYKLFRKEGNILIDVYEVIVGEPPQKYMAVPNLVLQESDPKYFGRGDTHKDALKDCLGKIRGVPIDTIIPMEGRDDAPAGRPRVAQSDRDPRRA
jgi:hypothetical protein